MSISTQPGGEQRKPGVVSTGRKPPVGAKKAPAKKATGAKKAPGRPGGAGGAKKGGGRRPIAPVKVNQQRPWGPIALFVAVGVLAAGIIGYGAWAVIKGSESWEDRAAGIEGIVNFRETAPDQVQTSHAWGPLTYPMNPPVGGTHNFNWQNCMGDVYEAPIANEHAVHSMEHGAVWITYQPSLPADQVEVLASKVRGTEYMLMSPVENLDRPISLQAWGYQLKLDSATDPRVDEFIKALRLNGGIEPGASCSGGITATGTTPRDIGKDQQQQQPMTSGG